MDTAYTVTTRAQRSMLGKRSGRIEAILTSPHGSTVQTVDAKTATEAKALMFDYCAAHAENATIRYLFCADESRTLLVVRYSNGCWGYDIIDPARSYASGCWMPNANRKAVIEAARSHAAQSWGGVIREM